MLSSGLYMYANMYTSGHALVHTPDTHARMYVHAYMLKKRSRVISFTISLKETIFYSANTAFSNYSFLSISLTHTSFFSSVPYITIHPMS